MMKNCVIHNGKIINIGDWDYQIQSVEVTPAVLDEDGNVVTEAVYEDQATNPLPEGATITERDFEYDADRGWYETGTSAPTTDKERVALLQEAVDFILMNY